MAIYRLEYCETNYGFVDVDADSLEDAIELANDNEGDVYITKSNVEIGDLIQIE